MTYQYRVRDPLGNVHEGEVDAASPDEARQQLARDGFRVLELEERADGELKLFARRVTRSDIIYATSQLAIMVETGITLSVALESIIEQEENVTLRSVLVDLKNSVEAGEAFSTALARHPKYFDRTYVALVTASEATGTLGEMLERIADYLRKELETRGRVRGAMAYPAVMALVAVSVTIFLLTYVLPKFAPLFQQQGARLPKLTRIMMAASDNLLAWWYLWLGGGVALIVGLIFALRTSGGRQAWDGLKINMPLLGPMFRKVTLGRSVRTLGTLVASDVSVLDALQLSADVAGNKHYEALWVDVLDRVTSGAQIHESIAGNPLVPPMLVQMIRSGEETGQLDKVLEKVSGYYEREVDQAVKNATALVEPLMIAVMGVVVGAIAMALLLPIFTLGRTVH